VSVGFQQSDMFQVMVTWQSIGKITGNITIVTGKT
jgi:hypothetical protein